MKFLSFINELAMRKGEVKYGKSWDDEFIATIVTDTEKMDYAFTFHAKKQTFPVVFKILLKKEFGYKESNYDKNKIANLSSDDRDRIVDLSKDLGYIWEMDFEDEEGSYSLQPKEHGASLQLFAGLEEIIRRFIKKYTPNVFYFGAYEEPSRIRLYRYIAGRIKKTGYESYEFDFSNIKYFFFLSREAIDTIKSIYWIKDR